MPTSPTTWQMIKAVQARIQTSLLVTDSQVTNASPFSVFSAADQALYGPNVVNAIYPWNPKEFGNEYVRQCHIVPVEELVYRRNFAEQVWDEMTLHVAFLYKVVGNAFQVHQDMLAARDAMHIIVGQFCELPGVGTVAAARGSTSGTHGPMGPYYQPIAGQDWYCWGFPWWYRQTYSIPGGIVP
jgi:hypothetical protein